MGVARVVHWMKRLAMILAVLVATTASAELGSEGLSGFVGVGYLGSPGGSGAGASTGVRLGVGTHFAASFDLGYGFLAAAPFVQDRWWVIPAVALVIPVGQVRFDIGVGLGVGTAAAFASWHDYGADHTRWAVQLIPAVRAHGVAAVALTHRLELFARVDAGALLVEGNSIGVRDGGPPRPITDTTWITLGVGLQVRFR